MVQIIWTEPAAGDLQEVHVYIAQDSPQNVRAMVLRIQAAVARLGAFPMSGRQVPEFPGSPYREVITGPYRHVPARDLVLITAVYHGRRTLPPQSALE